MDNQGERVFVSYARNDEGFALKLAKDLRAKGVSLWIDQLDIPSGTPWDQAVQDALKACPRFLVVLTPAAVMSKNVMDEISFALNREKKITPVLYSECEIPFRLERLHYINCSTDYDKGLGQLLDALKGTLDSHPSISRERTIEISGSPAAVLEVFMRLHRHLKPEPRYLGAWNREDDEVRDLVVLDETESKKARKVVDNWNRSHPDSEVLFHELSTDLDEPD